MRIKFFNKFRVKNGATGITSFAQRLIYFLNTLSFYKQPVYKQLVLDS